jgi:putative drug exporter of the RND superfamily
MIFDKLADGVIKHYKKILVAWVIVLLVSIPATIQLTSVTSYEETSNTRAVTESEKATKLIGEQFPTQSSNSSFMIVITGDDLRTPAVREYLLNLEANIRADPKIEGLENVTTIYSIYRMLFQSSITQLGPLAFGMEQNVSMMAMMIYGVPSMQVQTYEGAAQSASSLYSGPALYVSEWKGLNASYPNMMARNLEAYNRSWAKINPTISDPATKAYMMGYQQAFYAQWNRTFDNKSAAYMPNTTIDKARASATVMAVAPGYYNFTVPKTQQQMMMAGAMVAFDIYTYNVPQALNAFTYASMKIVLAAMPIQYGVPAAQFAAVNYYFDAYSGSWNDSFVSGKPNYLAPSTPDKVRAGAAINATAPTALGFGPGAVGMQVAFLKGVFQAFNINTWSNTAMVHGFVVNMMVAQFSSVMVVSPAFIEQAYSLGPKPTTAQVDALVLSIMMNGTYANYSLTLPASYRSSFINDKNDTMIMLVTDSLRAANPNQKAKIKTIISELHKLTAKGRSDAHLKTYVSGGTAISIDMEEAAMKDMGAIEPVTGIVAIVLVTAFFLSIVAAVVPFIGIGMAIMISEAVLFIIGTFVAKVNYEVTIILFTLLMGAGIDYSIFIMARYREERRSGHNKEEAVRTAVTWAGESITTSGIAVIIGFGSLMIMQTDMVRTMGLGLSIGIGITLLLALTFLPSLIMLFGDRIFWRPGGVKFDEEAKKAKKMKKEKPVFYFSKAADVSIKHPKAIILIFLLISVPTTYYYLTAVPSYDFLSGMPPTEGNKGIKVMGEGFGQGNIMPTQVVVEFADNVYLPNGSFNKGELDAIDHLMAGIMTVKNVKSVKASTYYQGQRLDQVQWEIYGLAMKNSTLRSSVGLNNKTVTLSVVMEKEPFTTASLLTIPKLRKEVHDMKGSDPLLGSATIYVGGSSASMNDMKETMDKDLFNMRVVVIVGIFILLLVVLGSVLVPIEAIISIALSITWTMAATMLVFQIVVGIPVLFLIPLILFVILMGLGMDYNIFIITRVREELAKGASDEVAIKKTVERTGGIITICGLIMAGTFGTMMISSLAMLNQFGFALFFSIILDAFVVRIYLMPAVLIVGKKWNWWAPGRLQRVKREEFGKGKLDEKKMVKKGAEEE